MPGLSDSLRWVKSEEEIAILRQASPIADKAMLEVARQARPGMTTRDAAAIASQVFLRERADTGEVGSVVKATGSHEFLHGAFKTETINGRRRPACRTRSARQKLRRADDAANRRGWALRGTYRYGRKAG
jgi:Xaa-Pro aminopeptidase